jgi:translation elongation factor EF-1alpha
MQTRSIRKIESGVVTVNNVVISDPRVQFGGIKNVHMIVHNQTDTLGRARQYTNGSRK